MRSARLRSPLIYSTQKDRNQKAQTLKGWNCALAVAATFLFCAVQLPVAADQTDTRLDSLFEELRTGGAINADANADRILEIWADSQSDTIDILYERSLAMYHGGEFRKAAAILNYVRGISPNFMQGYALSGFVKLSIEDNAGALSDFARALELEPRQFEVRKVLAQMLLASGEKRDAYEMIQRGLEWHPHDEELLTLSRRLRSDLEGQEI